MTLFNLLFVSLLYTLPGAVVMLVSVLLGFMDWRACMLGLPFLYLAAVGLSKTIMSDFRRVAAYARTLRELEPAEPPRGVTVEAAAELCSLFTQLNAAHLHNAEQLQARTKANTTILNNLPTPVLILNGERQVKGFNQAATRLFKHVLHDQDITRHIRDPIVLDCIDEVLEGKDALAETEMVVSADTQRFYDVLIARLPDNAPDGMTLVLTFSDLTELRKMEQMRADFAADAGHELRTPLTVVLGIIETLQGVGKNDPKALESFLPVMQDQALRMQRLVEDLLSLARIELNEHTPPEGEVDLRHTLNKVVTGLKVKAAKKNMRLTVDVKCASALATGDDSELGRIFQNLVDNAVKYGTAGTAVNITLSPAHDPPPAVQRHRHKHVVAVSVSDQGEGIAKEHLPRLTERFYRVDTARSRAVGGTGLGLAIVKHLVQRHRGHLTIDSTPDVGTTFTVYLPLREQDKPELRLTG